MERVDLATIIREVVATYTFGESAPVDTTGVPGRLELQADPGQLRQLVSNLLKNALEAAGADGTVRVSVDLIRKANEDHCRLQIEDDGPGIRDDQQTRVFDPYVTTKRKGTGLGLAIVQRIVFDHHGQIWFETQPGVGTTFYVDLPLGPAATDTRSADVDDPDH